MEGQREGRRDGAGERRMREARRLASSHARPFCPKAGLQGVMHYFSCPNGKREVTDGHKSSVRVRVLKDHERRDGCLRLSWRAMSKGILVQVPTGNSTKGKEGLEPQIPNYVPKRQSSEPPPSSGQRLICPAAPVTPPQPPEVRLSPTEPPGTPRAPSPPQRQRCTGLIRKIRSGF